MDQQVLEKKALKAAQLEADRFYAQQSLDHAKHALHLEKECMQERKAAERELSQFLVQSHQDKREETKRVERESREVGEQGVSSLQVFEGEDRDFGNRRRFQAEQQKHWVQQQVAEKNLKKQHDAEQDLLIAERTEDVTHRAYQIERSIRQKRRDQAVATAEFNKSLLSQKERESFLSKQHDQSCKLEEIQNMLDSDLLNGTKNEGNYYGKRGQKGTRPPSYAEIQNEQSGQREENAYRKEMDKKMQKNEDRIEEHKRRVAVTLERNWARQRKNLAKQIGSDRRAQVEEAAQHRQAELDREKSMDNQLQNTTGFVLA